MWPNPQETADLVTFTEEILNGKLHFLCSEVQENTHFSEFYLNSKLYEKISNNPVSYIKMTWKRKVILFYLNLFISFNISWLSIEKIRINGPGPS